MDIKNLLSLEPSPATLKKLDKFLQEENPNTIEYAKVLVHFSQLTFSLDNREEAFVMLHRYYESCPRENRRVVIDGLINLYYQTKDYQNALAKIELKKKYLTVDEMNVYTEDLIRHYEINGDDALLVKKISDYLQDDIDSDTRLKYLNKLADIYLKKQDYKKFQEKNDLIKTLSLEKNLLQTHYISCYNEAYMLIQTHQYLEALNEVNYLLDVDIEKEYIPRLHTLKLKALIGLNEFRKASIFEAEYYEEILSSDLENRIQFCLSCMDLYTKNSNKFSYEQYKNEYDKLVLEKNKEVINDDSNSRKKKIKHVELHFDSKFEAPKTPIDDSINTNQFEENKQLELDFDLADLFKDNEVIPDEVKVKNVITKRKYSYVLESEMYSKLTSAISKVDSKGLKLREYLRRLLLEVNKFVIFDSAFILLSNGNYQGFYYKKERLYDKDSNSLDVFNTISLEAYNSKEEEIIPSSKECDYIDIISKKEYKELEDDYKLCAFPLKNGSITFTSLDEQMLERPLNYEGLELLSMILDLKLESELEKNELNRKFSDLTFVMENNLSGYKRQIGNRVYLSEKAKAFFNTYEILSVNEYYSLFDDENALKIRKFINDFLTNKTNENSIVFSFNDKYYEEIYSKTEEGTLFSIINDVTLREEESKHLEHFAFYDPKSRLNNNQKLLFDLEHTYIPSKKFGLLTFDITNYKKFSDIYGLDFADQLLRAVGKYLKQYDKEIIESYRIDSSIFMVIIPNQNDKRKLNTIANNLLEFLTRSLYELNQRLDVIFSLGILRYPQDTATLDVDKIKKLAFDSLLCAKTDEYKTVVANYSEEEYKKRFFEEQLKTHISESIDRNELMINYRQVCDMHDSTCDHYIASVNLSNYPIAYSKILSILQKRMLVAVYEKYKVHKALFELNKLSNEKGKLVKVMFELSIETISDPQIVKFMQTEADFFKIPHSVISICYDGEATEIAIKALKELRALGFKVASRNEKVLKSMRLDYFYYDVNENITQLERDYLLMINAFCKSKDTLLVIGNVNIKEIIANLVSEHIYLYEGPIFRNSLQIDDIIRMFK